MNDVPAPSRAAGPRYGRESLEFGRLANLSDAVFAIAMTLLVLGIEVPDRSVDELGPALTASLPRLAAFVLGFALVASIWWQHHKLLARLAFVDRTLVVLNLVFLGGVALVPFPTGLLGSFPTDRATVLAFVAVFLALQAVFLALVVRAHRARAWADQLPPGLFPWILSGFVVTMVVVAAAAAVAVLSPLAGLAVLALSSVPEAFLARRAPPGYRDWS